ATSRHRILDTISTRGYAVLRGLFDERSILTSRDAVYRYANSAEHRPSTGVAADEIRRNVSKWSIGGRRDQVGRQRFALVVYDPLYDRDIFRLHSYFECIIEVRDRLAGREILRDSVLLPDRFNACRVQIYPAGGGFLGEHRDLRGQSNLPEGLYLELLL